MENVSSSFGPQMAVGAQQHARFVLRLRQVIVIERGGAVIHAVVRAPDLEIGLDRNDDEVVLRIAEYGALGLGHADHFERQAFER